MAASRNRGASVKRANKRFVFKSFTERVEEVDIDVFRSLDAVRFQPTEGSSFFHENLIRWRELNAAADFISAHDELLPLVQTLPQVLLHKATIVNRLLSCLNPSAVLSLEPILSLIAILSRDLCEEFLLFIPQIFYAFVKLLQLGGDRDPMILEQTFTSISYIFKYMLKFLSKDVVFSLKITKGLRFYQHHYVRVFAAEAVSFLLRNAPIKEVIKGVRKSLAEVERDSREEMIAGCSALFVCTMKGPSNGFHSRAEELLKLLLNQSILGGIHKERRGGEAVLQVLRQTFCNLCEDVHHEKRDLLWSCLLDEITPLLLVLEKHSSIEHETRMVQLLSLLNSMIEFKKGRSLNDYKPLFALAPSFLSLVPKLNGEPQLGLLSEIFAFLLNLLKSQSGASIGQAVTLLAAPSWASAFESTTAASLVPFMKGLLKQESGLVQPFVSIILRAFERFIDSRQLEILPMLLDLLQKFGSRNLRQLQSDKLTAVVINVIKASLDGLKLTGQSHPTSLELAMVWTALQCVPHLVISGQKPTSLCWEYATAIDQLLLTKGSHENAIDTDVNIWESLLGAALSSHLQILQAHKSDLSGEIRRYLDFGLKYHNSSHVLEAVAACIAASRRKSIDEAAHVIDYSIELSHAAFLEDAKVFEKNLGMPRKRLRLATLQILSFYEPFPIDTEQGRDKRLKGNDGQAHASKYYQVIHDLVSIEASPLDLEHCRRSSSLISQIKMHIHAERVPMEYIRLVFRAMIGVLHNPFTPLWDSATDCLVSIMEGSGGTVWNDYFHYLSETQNQYLMQEVDVDSTHDDKIHTKDLVGCWEFFLHDSQPSTRMVSVMTLLLRIGQKIPSFVESRSRQLVPLYLTFIVYSDEKDKRFSPQGSISGKDWKVILKEWLTLLVQLKNAHTLSEGPVLKQVLIERFLVDSDPDIQKKAMDCLLNWKDKFLTAYKDHLNNLISLDTLGEELVAWDVGRESQNVADEHREGLLPILLRILYPKLTKRGAKSGKSAGRSTILSFLSRLDVMELGTFFCLVIHPLQAAFFSGGSQVVSEAKYAWQVALEQGATDNFIEWVNPRAVAELPHKRKIGFLHLVKDVLDVFDGEHIEPYLHALLAFVLRFLESASVKTEDDGKASEVVHVGSGPRTTEIEAVGKGRRSLEHAERKGSSSKDLRTLCLKNISLLLNKFEHIDFSSVYWDIFFQATEHSITNMKEENAHGDNPSAILSCFLAMSMNSEFTRLLLRNMVLLPNLLSILLVKGLSSSVHSAVLCFIENILGMDKENIQAVLVPHLNVLLRGLAEQLTCSGRKSKQLMQRQLRILTHLSQFIYDSSQAADFLDTLLPFLRMKKHVDPETCIGVLTIIKCMSSAFHISSASKCSDALAPLLASISFHEVRSAVCEILQNIAQVDPSLLEVAQILMDLNSMSTSTVGEYDYQCRQMAYGRMNHSFLSHANPKQAVLLLSQIVFDLESEDMRYNASNCLVSFVKAVGENILKQDVKLRVQDFLFSHIKTAMESESTAIRREWLIVFRELVSLSGASKVSEHSCLISSDPEVDFFGNIVHVQVHRRIKAMARFRVACNKAQFSQDALMKIFVPLFTHSLFEVRSNKDGNLVDAAVETLGCIAGQLQWTPYSGFLMKCFRLLATKSEHQKVLVRLICLILDKLQSHLRTNQSEVEDNGNDMPVKPGDFSMLPATILENLQQRVLPELNKLMLKKDSVNVSVVLAMVKVLKLMPEQVLERELPRILQTITNLLKSRSQDVRDEARSAIVGVADVLGAQHLQFIVKMLQASLKRGYEKHVLGYTINAILIRMVPKLKVGDIDYCVDDLLCILESEVFGEISEEKEVEALAGKMKERKQARSFDSMRLVAQVVTFCQYANHLLNPVRQNALSSKVQEKIQLFLNNVAMGIQANPSASEEQVLVFVHGLVEEFLKQEAALEVQPVSRPRDGDTASTPNLHLLSEFALQVLQNNFKSNQLKARDAKVVSMLNPFVGLLQRCLSVKYDGVISAALRCLTFLLRLPLPATEALGGPIISSVFSIAESSPNVESPLLQACLKLLTVVLRHCKSVNLAEDQVHALLHFPIFVDIESQGAQALSLLKTVVERKLVVPELYDLMNRVQQLMVTSQAAAVRQRCSEVLLQFLLDYPLGTKRLQHHLDFLLMNLGYEHISGREAALEMLHTIIVKFPDAVLQEQAESLFLTLVTRLVNDKANHVRALLETVLKVLMGRVGPQALQRIMQFLLSWMTGDKQALWLPAAQVTGLLIDVMDQFFERHIADFLPAVLKLLKQKHLHKPMEGNDTSESGGWKETYYALTTIERLLQKFPDQCLLSLEEMWPLVSELLLHRHTLVRNVCARLFGLYLATFQVEESGHEWKQPTLLMDSSWVLLLAAYFCQQFDTEMLDEVLGEQLVRNLTSLAPALHSLSLKSLRNGQLVKLQEDRVSRALSMLETRRKTESMMAELGNLVSKEDSSALMLIFRRLERIALRFHSMQAKCIFRWYASVIARLGGEVVMPYLPFMLQPLLRIGESTSSPEDLKIYAEELRNDIRESVGSESFARVYNEVTQGTKIRKEERKRAQSIAALVDPEKNARKKIKLGLKKKAQKKRKRSDFRKH